MSALKYLDFVVDYFASLRKQNLFLTLQNERKCGGIDVGLVSAFQLEEVAQFSWFKHQRNAIDSFAVEYLVHLLAEHLDTRVLLAIDTRILLTKHKFKINMIKLEEKSFKSDINIELEQAHVMGAIIKIHDIKWALIKYLL